MQQSVRTASWPSLASSRLLALAREYAKPDLELLGG